MAGNQKRKRKRKDDPNKTPAKKARKTTENTPKTPKSDKKRYAKRRSKALKKPVKAPRKRKVRIPKKVRFLREKIARVIERALVEAPKVPLIYHLFTERDSMGTPKALLSDVFKQLKISDFVKQIHILRDSQLLSLTYFTTLFAVERDDDYGRLYLKYWPIYDKQAATVYIDNLPEGCNEEKLMRLAKCFGTVAEVSIMKKSARWIRPKHHPRRRPNNNQNHQNQHNQHNQPSTSQNSNPNPAPHPRRRHPYRKKPLINVGSRPRAFGFVRFVDADSADAMVAEFRYNDPSLPYEKFEAQRNEELRAAELDFLEFGPGDPENLAPPVVPQELPRQKAFKENYMMKLIYEIRHLRMRRKRRTYPMFMRLKRLRKRLRLLRAREYTCLRKAGLVERHPRMNYRKRRENALKRRKEKLKNARRPGGLPRQPSAASKLRRRLHNFQNATKAKLKRKEARERAEAEKAAELAAAIARGEIPEPEPEKPAKPEKKKRKKKRKRKKMSRKLPQYIPGGQVRRYFIDTQVLSMKHYLKLKAEYLELIRLEKERVREERDAPQIPDDIEY